MIGKYLTRYYSIKKIENKIYYDIPEISDIQEEITVDFNTAQRNLIERIAASSSLTYIPGRGKMLVREPRFTTYKNELRNPIEESANVYWITMQGANTAYIWNVATKCKDLVNTEYSALVWKYDLQRLPGGDKPSRDVIVKYDHWKAGNYTLPEKEFPSLQILCMRKLMSSNLAYGGTSEYPYVHNGAYVAPAVVNVQITKLLKPHISFNCAFDYNHAYQAIKYYYKYCVRPKKQSFTITMSDFKHFKYASSSKAGFYFIKDAKVYEDRDIIVRYTKSPTREQSKHLEMRNMAKVMRVALRNAMNGQIPIEKPLFPGVTTARVKDQFINLYAEEGADPSDYSKKGRVFFNPKDLQINRLFKMRHNERTYYPSDFPSPRGKPGIYINMRNDIGQKWIKGGAHLKYLSLRGDRGDVYERMLVSVGGDHRITYKWKKSGTQLFGEFDVSSFDLSILAPMLMSYFHCAKYWVLEEDTWEYRFFLYMLEYAAEALTSNVVQYFRDFLLVVGMMPSGSSETSHGDTWIMLIFFLLTFIFFVISKVDKDRRKQVIAALYDVLIVALAYGDDCNYSYPRALADIIGVHALAEFCSSMYGAKLRNVNEHTSLITYMTYSEKLGCVGYVYKGPIYLKRYYVWDHNFRQYGIAQVLPWRTTEAYRWRIAMPKNPSGSLLESVPRLIGLVYDTIGVDEYQYNLVKDMYTLVMDRLKQQYSIEFLYKEISEGLKKDDKYFRKIGLNTIDAYFPTFNELNRLNRIDWEYHKPLPHRTWQQWINDDAWW